MKTKCREPHTIIALTPSLKGNLAEHQYLNIFNFECKHV